MVIDSTIKTCINKIDSSDVQGLSYYNSQRLFPRELS